MVNKCFSERASERIKKSSSLTVGLLVVLGSGPLMAWILLQVDSPFCKKRQMGLRLL